MKPNKETFRLAFILYLLPLINEKVSNDPSANKIDDHHKEFFGEDYKHKAVSGKQVMRIINNEDDARVKTKDETLSKLGRVYGGDITTCDIFEKEYNNIDKRRYNKDIVKYVKDAIEYLSTKPKKYSSRDNSAFLGIWKGLSKEKQYTTENNESVEKEKFIGYKIYFEINAKKISEVTGTIEIFYHDQLIKSHQHQTFTFSGKVISNSLLFVEYKNNKSSAFHFGSILFKLNAIGDTLTGAFVGYGITAEQIVHGEVTVSKALSTHS